jgi:hypothetical protein
MGAAKRVWQRQVIKRCTWKYTTAGDQKVHMGIHTEMPLVGCWWILFVCLFVCLFVRL